MFHVKPKGLAQTEEALRRMKWKISREAEELQSILSRLRSQSELDDIRIRLARCVKDTENCQLQITQMERAICNVRRLYLENENRICDEYEMPVRRMAPESSKVELFDAEIYLPPDLKVLFMDPKGFGPGKSRDIEGKV